VRKLHPRSRHIEAYDFEAYCKKVPELRAFLIDKKDGQTSIDFGEPLAVRLLNQAILLHHYDLAWWEIPDQTLCPAIPGRAEYVHFVADLLAESNAKKTLPVGKKIKMLDIGTGASLIYPLIASRQYRWSAIASEVNKNSFESSKAIIKENGISKDEIDLRLQKNKELIFEDILDADELIDIVICNPPFHRSKEEAAEHTKRKWRNLGHTKGKRFLNFGGQSSELWYQGGERIFIKKMILESTNYRKSVLWFSSLVSKKDNIDYLAKQMEKNNVYEMKEIEMALGNKKSRFIAWTFLNEKQRKAWAGFRF